MQTSKHARSNKLKIFAWVRNVDSVTKFKTDAILNSMYEALITAIIFKLSNASEKRQPLKIQWMQIAQIQTSKYLKF